MKPRHERFWSKVLVRDNGCWEWIACRNRGGYGKFGITQDGKHITVLAHHLTSGPFPADWVVHHKCENKACVNPEHLHPMPDPDHHKEHVGTHCRRGHEMTPENSGRNGRGRSKRFCRRCHNESQMRRYYERTKT